MTGFLLRVSQNNFQVSAGALFLSGGPGEESTPKLVLVVGSIQLLAVVRWGPPSMSSVSPAGHSQLLGATHIPCPVALSFPKVINRSCLVH